MGRLASWKEFIEECVAEMQKVTWPDQDQLRNATWVVILFTILVSGIIWIMDIASRLVIQDFIMGLFGVLTEASRWYAVQTYSGHENKVQRLIQHRIEEEPGSEEERELRGVLVPTQEVTEIRNGKRVQVTKRLYPGYVLVHMDLNDRTKHIINGIQGVIKFVGTGRDPQPLREDEINKILGVEVEDEQTSQEEIPFQAGQVVEVMQGPFTDFSGTIQEVYPDKGKVKVEVSLFGRPTSVELDFTQLKGF